jgi:hypothetical protein
MEATPSFELVAASLRADTEDLDVFVGTLAFKLRGALGERVRVERGGLFGRGRVRRIDVSIGENRYELSYDRGEIRARRARVVHGIVLKNEELSLEEWIDALSRDLAVEADTNERCRLALERLLGA